MSRYTIHDGDAVRQADELVGLWVRNLPVSGDARRRLRWMYVDAPAGPGRTLLLSDGASAVGCAGIGERRFWSRGGAVRAAVMADLAVDRPHRTLQPALQLVRAARARRSPSTTSRTAFPTPWPWACFSAPAIASSGA